MQPKLGPVLDMSQVQGKLDTLALAMANKIEREWPSRYSALDFAPRAFGMMVRLARITFRTVCFLCADQRQQEADWKWYYTLAVPTLNRTILDAIFNVVFMFEDLEERSQWYLKSGWKEFQRDFEQYKEAYSGDDPQWAEWLRQSQELLDGGANLIGITTEERLQKLEWWPNPGQMVNYGVNPISLPPDRRFLKYINDWFYRESSAHSHQSFFGFIRFGGLLVSDSPGFTDEQRERVEKEFYPKHRAVQVSRTVILLLALISEIERYFSFGLGPTVVDLWVILGATVPEAKEVYEKRYATFWPILSV